MSVEYQKVRKFHFGLRYSIQRLVVTCKGVIVEKVIEEAKQKK